jgi:hypothetical protein
MGEGGLAWSPHSGSRRPDMRTAPPDGRGRTRPPPSTHKPSSGGSPYPAMRISQHGESGRRPSAQKSSNGSPSPDMQITLHDGSWGTPARMMGGWTLPRIHAQCIERTHACFTYVARDRSQSPYSNSALTITRAVRDHPRHRLHEPSCHMPSYHIHHASTVACGPGVPMHLHVIRIFRMYAIQLYASNTSPVCLRCHHPHASTHMPTDHNRAPCTFVSPNPGTPV